MKELFRFYDEVVHSCESLTNKLYKAENNPKIKEDVIINLKQNLTEKKACKNIFSKGFVHFTMPLFTKQRAERLRKATASLATVFFTTSSSIQKSSTDFFEVMKINPADIITEICKSLELLSLKPLELPPFIPEIGSTEGTKLHEADPVFDLYNYAQDQADEVLEDTVIRKDFDHRQSSDAAKESAGPTTSNSDSEKRKSKGLGFNFSSLRRGRKSDPPAPTLTIGGASVTPPPEQLDPRETFDYTKNHVETIDINGSDSSIVTSKASPNAEYTSLGSSSPPPYSIVPAISAIPTFNKNEKSLNLLSELTGGEEKPKFTSFRDSEFEN